MKEDGSTNTARLNSTQLQESQVFSVDSLRTTRVMVAGRPLLLSVAETPAQIQQGLSGVEELSTDGLLFILPTASRPRFWMKDMLFNLDFLWIDTDTVVDITLDLPAPSPMATPNEIAVVQPKQTVTHVIELPAGVVEMLGFQVGDRVENMK